MPAAGNEILVYRARRGWDSFLLGQEHTGKQIPGHRFVGESLVRFEGCVNRSTVPSGPSWVLFTWVDDRSVQRGGCQDGSRRSIWGWGPLHVDGEGVPGGLRDAVRPAPKGSSDGRAGFRAAAKRCVRTAMGYANVSKEMSPQSASSPLAALSSVPSWGAGSIRP
jgi:hypothetical protein